VVGSFEVLDCFGSVVSDCWWSATFSDGDEMKQLFALILFLLAPHVYAEDILSKADAHKTFNLSFVQWVANLDQVSSKGLAKVTVASEFEWTMTIEQPEWILGVTPTYLKSNLQRPHKITTSVQYPKNASSLLRLTDEQLQSMIQKWQNTMLPEYSVLTRVDLQDGIAQVDFTIFEFGRYPEIDKVAKQMKGCWQGCIRR
jgi:hypothetical protein